jgi:N-acylneuraminate cytidylyltransferase
VKVLAVIPARGGSKTIPRKNLRLLRGQPLIVHTFAAAARAKALDRVVVSTDDDTIAGVASRHGIEVIRRPAALATDDAKTGAAIRHALGELARGGWTADAVVTLQPTSPLRAPDLIDRVVAAFEESGCDTALTVTRVSTKVGRIADGWFAPLYPTDSPRQALDGLYVENGNVYVTRADVVREHGTVFGARLRPVEIDDVEGLDLDTELDVARAEFWLERFPDRFGGGVA